MFAAVESASLAQSGTLFPTLSTSLLIFSKSFTLTPFFLSFSLSFFLSFFLCVISLNKYLLGVYLSLSLSAFVIFIFLCVGHLSLSLLIWLLSLLLSHFSFSQYHLCLDVFICYPSLSISKFYCLPYLSISLDIFSFSASLLSLSLSYLFSLFLFTSYSIYLFSPTLSALILCDGFIGLSLSLLSFFNIFVYLSFLPRSKSFYFCQIIPPRVCSGRLATWQTAQLPKTNIFAITKLKKDKTRILSQLHLFLSFSGGTSSLSQ